MRRGRAIACAIAAAAATSAGSTAPSAAAMRHRSVTVGLYPASLAGLLPLPRLPEAVEMLNEQRAASGIPPLVAEPTLSAGCLSWASEYHPAAGQFPHAELESQPGYTKAGAEAVGVSDLAGDPAVSGEAGVGAEWGPSFNPWSEAPLHETALLNPATTSAWYGGTYKAACMGTGGSRPFTEPTFYSYPANGSTNVPTAEHAGEEPFTPQQALGLKYGAATGPTIILWPEGTTNELASATLSSAAETVPLGIVRPGTAAPPAPPGWPPSTTMGAYQGTADYVIPLRALAPDTSYALEAQWGTHATKQVIQFTTGASNRRAQVEATLKADVERLGGIGGYTMTLRGRTLSVTATGLLAIGHPLHLRESYVACKPTWHPFCREPTDWRRTIRLSVAPQTFTVPAPRHPQTFVAGVFYGYAYGASKDYIQPKKLAVIVF